jgi:mediator of RNA polymerase II transcription subunit 10
MMVQTTTYDAIPGPTKSRDVLANEVRQLSRSLGDVHASAQRGEDTLPKVPIELIQYVENGRNPDIYTREFTELVRRTNQVMKGKREAFGRFRDVLATQIKAAMPELSADVDMVVTKTGGPLPPEQTSLGIGEKKEEGNDDR